MSESIFETFTDERGNISVRVSRDVQMLTREEAGCIEAEYKQMQAENDKLRELVRDYIDAPCTTCDCWQDEFRCWNYDGADCGLVARARELGTEVD